MGPVIYMGDIRYPIGTDDEKTAKKQFLEILEKQGIYPQDDFGYCEIKNGEIDMNAKYLICPFSGEDELKDRCKKAGLDVEDIFYVGTAYSYYKEYEIIYNNGGANTSRTTSDAEVLHKVEELLNTKDISVITIRIKEVK